MRKLFMSAALLVAAVTALSTTSQAQQLTIKVGYTFNAPPIQTSDPNTLAPTGAGIDVMNAIAKDAGFRVEFHPFISGDVPAAANAKIIDLYIGQFTPDRTAMFDFSDTVFMNNEGMYVKKTDTKDYKGWEDLKGGVVVAPAGNVV